MYTELQLVPIALIASLLLSSNASPAGTPLRGPTRTGEATCPVNITATNKGSTDIWLMLYDSEVRRSISYVKLKIQNHRVAPGATISRSYMASGSCNTYRRWRFTIKRGTDFRIQSTSTSGSSAPSQLITLGDLARFF